jgi:hypothetical protein
MKSDDVAVGIHLHALPRKDVPALDGLDEPQ